MATTEDRGRAAAEETRAEVEQRMRELGRELKVRATDVKNRAAAEFNLAAERIRAEAHQTGDQEAIQRANQIATGLERAATYLNSRSLDQIGEDVAHTAQQNIWQSLGIAFVAGLILGLLLGGGRRS